MGREEWLLMHCRKLSWIETESEGNKKRVRASMRPISMCSLICMLFSSFIIYKVEIGLPSKSE